MIFLFSYQLIRHNLSYLSQALVLRAKMLFSYADCWKEYNIRRLYSSFSVGRLATFVRHRHHRAMARVVQAIGLAHEFSRRINWSECLWSFSFCFLCQMLYFFKRTITSAQLKLRCLTLKCELPSSDVNISGNWKFFKRMVSSIPRESLFIYCITPVHHRLMES